MFDMFDEMFDFDNNGELDSLEQAAEFSFAMGMIEEEDEDHSDSDDLFSY